MKEYTKEELNLPEITFKTAVNMTFRMLEYAQVGISDHRVGACVAARSPKAEKDGTYPKGYVALFPGCNIELATNAPTGWHAERVALIKALSGGATDILACFVTSDSIEQRAAMCGYCMQDFMYVNPDAFIIVLNPDKSVKLITTVKDRNGELAYWGRGKIQQSRKQS